MTFVLVLKKKIMKILKDNENNNTVVIYLTEIFVFLVKQYLTVISQKFPLIIPHSWNICIQYLKLPDILIKD
jgi:hypothetical protein